MTEPNQPEGRPRDADEDAAENTTDATSPDPDESGAAGDPDETGAAGDPPRSDDVAVDDGPDSPDAAGAEADPPARAENAETADDSAPDAALGAPASEDDSAEPPTADDPAYADFAGADSDAPAAEGTPAEGADAAFPEPDPDTGDGDAPEREAPDPAAAAAALAGSAAAAMAADDAPRTTQAGGQTGAATGSPAAERVVVEKRGGFVPGFVGGVFAVAGIVFAAPYVLPQDLRPITSLAPVEADIRAQQAAIDQQAETVADLSSQIATLVDASAETGALDALAASTEDSLGALRGDLDALAQRLDEMTRSAVDDSLDPQVRAALDSYSAEVAQLRESVDARLAEAEAAMAAQTEENRRLIAEATAAAEAAYADAEAEAAAAEEEAAATRRRQALIEVREALEAGEPFAETLATLDPGLVPAALTDASETGVPTLAALQADFAAPARAALDAARRAVMPEGPTARVTTFMQTQLGVRSLAPRDGDSPDAVLSRAEAALRNADLATAIDEIGALPDVAQAEMADWVGRASARAEAVAAADELAATLATN